MSASTLTTTAQVVCCSRILDHPNVLYLRPDEVNETAMAFGRRVSVDAFFARRGLCSRGKVTLGSSCLNACVGVHQRFQRALQSDHFP